MMLKIIRRAYLYLLTLLVSAVWVMPASAIIQLQGDLTYEYQVSSGQIIHGQLQVHNPDAKPTTVRILKQDADSMQQNRHHSRSNVRWVHLSQETINLAPRSTVNVSYHIQIPQGAAQGTHWSKLIIDPVSQNSSKRQDKSGVYTVGVQQKVRYSVNVMTHVGQGQAKLNFQKPTITRHNNQRLFQFNVQNNGSLHSLPEVSIDIFTTHGKRVVSLTGNQRGLFPGYSKTFEIPLRGIQPGMYKALLVAIDQKTGRTFGTDIDLSITP